MGMLMCFDRVVIDAQLRCCDAGEHCCDVIEAAVERCCDAVAGDDDGVTRSVSQHVHIGQGPDDVLVHIGEGPEGVLSSARCR